MDSYIFFRLNKRVNLRDDNLQVDKIGRIFQVTAESLYLTDDSNHAIFPNERGEFWNLVNSGHYEVHGDSTVMDDQPQSSGRLQHQQLFNTPSSSFAFAQRSAGTPCALSASSTCVNKKTSKTFQRCVQLVDSSLVTLQTIYLKVGEHEANVATVTQKIQEQIDSDDIVITDSKGQEIIDTQGTQGPEFWKTQSRKIFCMTNDTHLEFLNKRKPKHRRLDTANMQLEQNAEIADCLAAAKQLKNNLQSLVTATDQCVLLKLSREQIVQLQESFSCVICKGAMQQPVFATCCHSLIGCKSCMDEWLRGHSTCPKCRQMSAEGVFVQASGIHEVIQSLSAVFP